MKTITMDGQEYPLVLGTNSGKKSVKIECPYCEATHIHGRAEGHRVSHCCDKIENGVLIKRERNIGYVIKLQGK